MKVLDSATADSLGLSPADYQTFLQMLEIPLEELPELFMDYLGEVTAKKWPGGFDEALCLALADWIRGDCRLTGIALPPRKPMSQKLGALVACLMQSGADPDLLPWLAYQRWGYPGFDVQSALVWEAHRQKLIRQKAIVRN
jgi:hypothetical protein